MINPKIWNSRGSSADYDTHHILNFSWNRLLYQMNSFHIIRMDVKFNYVDIAHIHVVILHKLELSGELIVSND